MKYLYLLTVLLLVSCCRSSVDTLTFQQLKRDWGEIGPRYTTYVKEDTKLSDNLRIELLNHANTFGMLLDEAAKSQAGGVPK